MAAPTSQRDSTSRSASASKAAAAAPATRAMHSGPAIDLATLEQLFRAAADRTRLRILNLLAGGELCVCDLVSTLGVPQPTASRHLAYLRRAGLVEVRRDGLWMYYRLARPRSEAHAKLAECVGCCRELVPQLAKDIERLTRSRCC